MTKVQGLDRLRRKLTQTIPQRAKEATRQAMEKSAEEIVRAMRALAKGRIVETIGWTWGDAPPGSMALMSSAAGPGGMKITVYAGDATTMVKGRSKDFQLARLLEFGTQAMAAQPFFYPAYRLNKKRAANRIKRAIRKGVKEAMQS